MQELTSILGKGEQSRKLHIMLDFDMPNFNTLLRVEKIISSFATVRADKTIVCVGPDQYSQRRMTRMLDPALQASNLKGRRRR